MGMGRFFLFSWGDYTEPQKFAKGVSSFKGALWPLEGRCSQAAAVLQSPCMNSQNFVTMGDCRVRFLSFNVGR
jgi:hypothetical protein